MADKNGLLPIAWSPDNQIIPLVQEWNNSKNNWTRECLTRLVSGVGGAPIALISALYNIFACTVKFPITAVRVIIRVDKLPEGTEISDILKHVQKVLVSSLDIFLAPVLGVISPRMHVWVHIKLNGMKSNITINIEVTVGPPSRPTSPAPSVLPFETSGDDKNQEVAPPLPPFNVFENGRDVDAIAISDPTKRPFLDSIKNGNFSLKPVDNGKQGCKEQSNGTNNITNMFNVNLLDIASINVTVERSDQSLCSDLEWEDEPNEDEKKLVSDSIVVSYVVEPPCDQAATNSSNNSKKKSSNVQSLSQLFKQGSQDEIAIVKRREIDRQYT